jgi:mono/diheme cytochrome c family protein
MMTISFKAGTANPLHAQEAKGQPDGGQSQLFSPYVDAKGGISLPDDFETKFVHIGTVSVAAKPGEPVNELHGTYTRLEDLEAFRRDGHFPDGAVLVKDVRATTNEKLTTGGAAYGANVKVWFVMIKDAKGRFPENELWGDGWGWGLFENNDRTNQVAVNYKTECRSCHVPVRNNDWVYTKCYPALNVPSKKTATSEAPSEGQGAKPDLIGMFPQWAEAQKLKGDANAGRRYFESKTIENEMTCVTCHSFNQKDTMAADGDGLIRAGFPVFASLHRTNIKNSGTNLGALGGNMCVIHFMGGKAPGMDAPELANLNAFLLTGGKKEHATAANVDYAKATWTIPTDLAGGDPQRGEAFAKKSCVTCHDVADSKAKYSNAGGALKPSSYGPDDLKELALQIRNPDYKHNAEMPGYTDLRLSNQQLLDLIAWFKAK